MRKESCVEEKGLGCRLRDELLDLSSIRAMEQLKTAVALAKAAKPFTKLLVTRDSEQLPWLFHTKK